MTLLEGTDFRFLLFMVAAKNIKNLQKTYSIFAHFVLIYKENTLKTSTFTKGLEIDQ